MKKLALPLLGLMVSVATPAFAQDAAPDGSPAFGIEPYVGLMGGYEDFDSDERGPLTTNCNGASGCVDGGFIEAVAGVNVPLGPVFVGVEGNFAKGFEGLDYEYGGYGRLGVRAGDSGMIYGKVGYQWIDPDGPGNKDDGMAYGLGVEVGPQDIGLGGITGNSGVRLRLEVNTFDMQNIRPTAGVVFHF
jgi:outer membrane immunogenic protein